MPQLATRFEAIHRPAMLDGGIVALRNDETPSFRDLQVALSEGRESQFYFYTFDLLHLDGWDLRPCALIDRKRLLEDMHGWGGCLLHSASWTDDLGVLWQHACQTGLEGIIAKRIDAPYRAGRRTTWRKVKC